MPFGRGAKNPLVQSSQAANAVAGSEGRPWWIPSRSSPENGETEMLCLLRVGKRILMLLPTVVLLVVCAVAPLNGGGRPRVWVNLNPPRVRTFPRPGAAQRPVEKEKRVGGCLARRGGSKPGRLGPCHVDTPAVSANGRVRSECEACHSAFSARS